MKSSLCPVDPGVILIRSPRESKKFEKRPLFFSFETKEAIFFIEWSFILNKGTCCQRLKRGTSPQNAATTSENSWTVMSLFHIFIIIYCFFRWMRLVRRHQLTIRLMKMKFPCKRPSSFGDGRRFFSSSFSSPFSSLFFSFPFFPSFFCFYSRIGNYRSFFVRQELGQFFWRVMPTKAKKRKVELEALIPKCPVYPARYSKVSWNVFPVFSDFEWPDLFSWQMNLGRR